MANLLSWGKNSEGQLGNNSIDNKSSPVSVRKFVKISSGRYHSLAIDSAGMVWAWGMGSNYVLGTGDNDPKSSPVSIMRAGSYTEVCAGIYCSFAIDSTGMIWVWGSNSSGQLGNNNTDTQTSPVSIARAGSYIAIAAGEVNAYAIDGADGQVYSWGQGSAGRLGTGDTISRSSPVAIARLSSYTQISAGYPSCHAIDGYTGMIWSWGENYFGQLGNNVNGNNESSPVAVARAGSYIAVSGKEAHCLAIDGATGAILAWGYNNAGQLGTGNLTNQKSPVDIARVASYKDIATGGGMVSDQGHSLAVDSDGVIWSWGYNSSGQLGVGIISDQSSPVSIGAVKKYKTVEAGGDHSFGFQNSDISYFNQASVSDGTYVSSIIDVSSLVDTVQSVGTDTYFDTTAEVSMVDIYYTHQDGRQKIRLHHKSPLFTTNVAWMPAYTRDGTWVKSRIKALDFEGATVTLDGTNIPNGEDLTHSSGTMSLNS